MPRRSAPSLIRNLALAATVALASVAGAQTPRQSLTLTLDQARTFAVAALEQGDPALAVQLATGLLQANPRDPFVHYLMATAYAQMGQPRAARLSAARAYRFGDPGTPRMRAGQLAAQAALAENRPTLAQYWLRRTAIHATSPEDERLLARDYAGLRRINPWAFRLNAGLRPSTNINGGTDTALNIIDGIPDGGEAPASAQALSGLIGTLDGSVTRRLSESASHSTTLTGRLYIQRVRLSSSAQARAPMVTGTAFGATFGEVSLRHAFAVGPQDRGGVAALDFGLAESWYGGTLSYRQASVTGERNWRLTDGAQFQINAQIEHRWDSLYAANETDVLSVGAQYSRRIASGDTVSLSVALRDSRADVPNGTFRSASVRAGYRFAQRLGPARVDLGLVLGMSDYPGYVLSTNLGNRPREDKSAYADASFFFEDYDYAGFAPTLRLRAGRKTSNFSRFSTRDLSMTLGIQSKF